MTKSGMMKTVLRGVCGALALIGAQIAPVHAADDLESVFDSTLGTELRKAPAPRPGTYAVPLLQNYRNPKTYASELEAQIASLASPELGRIGVAAVDLSSGRSIAVLGDQPFPMASTVKVAIVATYLDGVDQGRWRLSDQFPLMVPLPSKKFAGPVAPVRAGTMMSAQGLIELALTRSDNQATDALLAAIGGPRAVNAWLLRSNIQGIHIDRDIATLVRDDGAVNPATTVDPRDSATPTAMVRLLSGLYSGRWLSPSSRQVLLGAMERCVTGKGRIRAQLPEGTMVAHKTGTLSNTASDIGLIRTADGRTMAVAIYVTGQGGKPNRDARIAAIARAIYDGYESEAYSQRRSASR
jgi:beta-lactamase class A